MTTIYLDNNATTPLLPAVWEAMRPFFIETFGNPASAHVVGRRARQALEDAREHVAELLGAFPDEVIFTSGATEANNLALFGLAGSSPAHLITSPIEHPSVAEPCRRLEQLGFAVDYLPVNREGIVQPDALRELLRPDTRLVSVMLANNETGAVQPIADLATARQSVLFHCDAVQAIGKLRVHFHELGMDALTFSAHKFHGPKGIGALVLRRGVRLPSQFHGGHQQRGLRPGTEPVALVVGLTTALDLAEREREPRLAHVCRLRQRLLDHLRREAAPVILNGPETDGVPHTLNLSFPGCAADVMLMSLDLAGIACSTGSACSSGSLLPSPVLRAMGVPDDVLGSAMRFSLSPLLTETEVNEAARRIVECVKQLRGIAEEQRKE